ncbi:MAG: hypothetical protein KJT01_08940 [Gemmatimonadetes bacterium]|nr:hypothetical protein [Gemmatimonadota bacterium]
MSAGGCASAPPVVTLPPDAMGAPPPVRWPVRTAPHVDLWLHGLAMLRADSAGTGSVVPLYRRGYRDSLVVVRNQAPVLTRLDALRDSLARRMAVRGYLSAEFVPFAFGSWTELQAVAERVLQVEGDPRRTGERGEALASVFPTPADRGWLRDFLEALGDEQARFFGAEYQRQLRARQRVVTAVDSLWQRHYRARLERFLNNTGQRQGELLLVLPLGGEGRMVPGREGRPVVAVPFPGRVEDAVEVVYVAAHEVTGTLVAQVVADHTTPAERRSGEGDRRVATGQVLAGAMLLEGVAPELADGYRQYYLRQAGERAAPAATAAQRAVRFAARFPLPEAIVTGLQRQVALVLGGI